MQQHGRHVTGRVVGQPSVVGETRARVPSFYALDVMRAVTGVVPDHRVGSLEDLPPSRAVLWGWITT